MRCIAGLTVGLTGTKSEWLVKPRCGIRSPDGGTCSLTKEGATVY